jgi:hypothetical protein
MFVLQVQQMSIKTYDMEKSGIVIVVIIMALLAACGFGKKHSTIVETSNNHRLRIEYSGRVTFNDEGTAIRSISPDGYVEYQNDDKKLNAKNDGRGGVSYELYDGYTKINLDEYGKKFIAEAVKVMKRKGYSPPQSN